MPSSKKQRAKQSKQAKQLKQRKEEESKEQQRKEEETKKEQQSRLSSCRHGMTEDKALFEEHMLRLHELWERKGSDDQCSIFVSKHPDLCNDQGFIKFVIGCCIRLLLGDPNDEEGAHQHAKVCMVFVMGASSA